MPQPPQLTQAEILALFSELARRPARRDRRLPLIWLSSQEHDTRVHDALLEQLGISSKSLPHAQVQTTSENTPRDVRQLLDSLCKKLATSSGRELRFRYHNLAKWLIRQKLQESGVDDRDGEIVQLLRQRLRQQRSRGQSNDQASGKMDLSLQGLLIWLISWAPEILFRATISGKIPGFGRRYWWFVHQQYLKSQQPVNFLSFAALLIDQAQEPGDSDQVDKLLVHTFLEDLRRAYHRRLWRIKGWRRTGYPVVLISNAIKDTAGYRLLQLVNDVRNETRQSDPLLVVCSSDEVPQDPTQATGLSVVEPDLSARQKKDPVYGNGVYQNWVKALPGSPHARVNTAWYLPISVTKPDSTDQTSGKRIDLRKTPRLARRGHAVALFIGVLLVLALVGWWQYGGGPGCSHIPFLGQVNVRSIEGQCIGYSDGSDFLGIHFRFNDKPGQARLRDVQDAIFRQNREARDIWEDNRTRPYVTIVYLGILTGRPTNPTEEAYSAEREELEGLAVAQREGIDESGTYSEPLLNIVIANAGHEMKHAETAVEMIKDLTEEDPRVVAVVGLVESRKATAKALEELNKIGLPTIATTLSADNLSNYSRLYLQLSASNSKQAEMIAQYAKQVLRVSEAQVYWTTGSEPDLENDLYVKTLVDGLDSKLKNFKINIAVKQKYDRQLDNVCGYQGVVIFAGRWSEFKEFLTKLEDCGPNRPLHVVADDSVSRYVANPALRANTPRISVTYVSKSTLATCKHLRGAQGRDEYRAGQFFKLIQKAGLLQPPRCGQENEEVGERVPLAYDSARLVLDAVKELGQDLRRDTSQEWNPRSIVPIAVYVKIFDRVHQRPYDGVSGTIDFENNSGEPVERRISLLRVEDISEINFRPKEVFHCGRARPGDDPACQVVP